MHPAIELIANQIGAKLSDRTVFNTPIFDGKTIATSWGEATAVSIKNGTYGNPTHYEVAIPFTDHTLLHELGHFFAARQEQRDLQEFGLGYTAQYNQIPCDDCVDEDEASIQEFIAQLFCVSWGKKYGISPLLGEGSAPSYFDDWSSSWDDYLILKFAESCDTSLNEVFMWQAMIRLREMELI